MNVLETLLTNVTLNLHLITLIYQQNLKSLFLQGLPYNESLHKTQRSDYLGLGTAKKVLILGQDQGRVGVY